MTEFVSAEALARLAAAGDPQVRLMVALAALGADRTQILGARSTARRGEIALPENERATAAFAELQSLLGAANAKAVRRSGIRARAAHLTESLAADGALPAPRWRRPSDQPPGRTSGHGR
ncbi:hypothetical protein [Streptomyces sp. A1547]|uniref:hypothetical protein n=1 Tax=Streptomyces sp. A1547 TaxID=2563105 RepID=UPI00109E6B3F|nr:hypothetical protein [Streptomyces sp. A1547]THA40983.1 hypothetical protein E6W17_03805 [Streptomyces sp. A1547]